ncbi:MAG TPA: AAA family ATPase [Acidimicrobiales bacterium]|nr:AAA family ATPase [Acidimicrobiales bacterium]
MAGGSKALLVTGPGGSGKSTLARSVAERLGWAYVSEDEYWVENGWGSGLRSPEHERIVQEQVARDLVAAHDAGRGVALEFILYSFPPNPLTAYQDVLSGHGIAYETVALKPTVDEVLRRMQQRGRPGDVDLERRRQDAELQVMILELSDIDPDWIIDPTGRTVEDLCQECAARLGQA